MSDARAERVRHEHVVGAAEDLAGLPPVLWPSGTTVRARNVIIATGVVYRRLEAEGVERLVGRGVHYGAASGHAPAYRDRHVAIVGAANSAGQAALNLADHASGVTMVVRGDSLQRMSRYLVDRMSSTAAFTC